MNIAMIIWLIIAIAFVLLEFFFDFYFLPFAIGAALALVTSFFGFDILWQIIIFAVVCVLAFVLFNPNKQRQIRKRDKYNEDSFED